MPNDNVNDNIHCNGTDCEISAGDVAREEVFPKKKHFGSPSEPADRACAPCRECGINVGAMQKTDCGKKDRSRPTNPGYEMIDPDDGTADAGKS